MNNCQFLIESISEAVIMLDQDGYIQYTNPAATLITGYSSVELINKSISVLSSHKDDSIKVGYELEVAKKSRAIDC